MLCSILRRSSLPASPGSKHLSPRCSKRILRWSCPRPRQSCPSRLGASLGRPGTLALNLNTKPYGSAFGRWLQAAGASVVGLEAKGHDAIPPEAVEDALKKNPAISLVSFVHAEAASGVANDAETIAGLARAHGALIVIDVVASLGAEELRLDEWAFDVAVAGPQKALAGPAGISIAALSKRAWDEMTDNPGAPPTRCSHCSTGSNAGSTRTEAPSLGRLRHLRFSPSRLPWSVRCPRGSSPYAVVTGPRPRPAVRAPGRSV